MQLLASTATNANDIVMRITDALPTVACEFSQITSCAVSAEDDGSPNGIVHVVARARGGASVGYVDLFRSDDADTQTTTFSAVWRLQ